MKRVAVQAGDFDVATELAALEALGGGGVASFTGVVRGGGGLVALELEHYPAMTQAQVDRICDEAMARWPLLGLERHPPLRAAGAGGAHRVRRHGIAPPRRRAGKLRLPDRLAEVAGTLLEEGAFRRRRGGMGRGAGGG